MSNLTVTTAGGDFAGGNIDKRRIVNHFLAGEGMEG